MQNRLDDIEWSWLGKAANMQITTYDLTCGAVEYRVVTEEIGRGQPQLVSLTDSGQPVADTVFEAVSDMMSRFLRIDALKFSCGDTRVMKNGKEYNFAGQLSFAVHGMSADEPKDADDECWEAQGYYDETTQGSVTLTSKEVISTRGPGTGQCIIGLGERIQIQIKKPDQEDE
ncbi:MAG: hypothetical protein AAFW68_03765 [Pseudomonadota bacterium]